jgi:3-oxoacyl-[acyl-carrier protein] reductase
MDLALNGRTALVTGGGTGIGAAIALGLAREGGAVAVVDRSAPAGTADILHELEAMGRPGRAYTADVRDHAAAARVVGKVVRDFGRLDVLVSNAGVTADAMIWRMTEAQWGDVLDVNLKGCFNYNQAAASVFKEQKRGRIVNIASINGLRGKIGQANYAASKGGIISFSKTLARELGRFNVNVNVVAPGMVLTEMSRRLPPEVLDAALDETVLGRLATPEDCANLVVFLCSDRACHITGEVIRVDGGQYI